MVGFQGFNGGALSMIVSWGMVDDRGEWLIMVSNVIDTGGEWLIVMNHGQ